MTKKNDKIAFYIKVKDIGLLKAALRCYDGSIQSRTGQEKIRKLLSVLDTLDNMTRYSYWKVQERDQENEPENDIQLESQIHDSQSRT